MVRASRHRTLDFGPRNDETVLLKSFDCARKVNLCLVNGNLEILDA
jgi:hypothetical protein